MSRAAGIVSLAQSSTQEGPAAERLLLPIRRDRPRPDRHLRHHDPLNLLSEGASDASRQLTAYRESSGFPLHLPAVHGQRPTNSTESCRSRSPRVWLKVCPRVSADYTSDGESSMSVNDSISRTALPIPDVQRSGLVTFDAKDPTRSSRRSMTCVRPRAHRMCS
jgi:hypothetical protein